jgi:hypothetical protein
VGTYEVVVGGIARGSLEVVDTGLGEIEGEIELDAAPDEPGEALLDFDPRGALVEVRQGGTVSLSASFPDSSMASRRTGSRGAVAGQRAGAFVRSHERPHGQDRGGAEDHPGRVARRSRCPSSTEVDPIPRGPSPRMKTESMERTPRRDRRPMVAALALTLLAAAAGARAAGTSPVLALTSTFAAPGAAGERLVSASGAFNFDDQVQWRFPPPG